MANLSRLDRSLSFRKTTPVGVGDDPGLQGLALVTSPAEFDLSPAAPSWVRRAASVFSAASPGTIADYFAYPEPFVEMRLCGGSVPGMDWEALIEVAERLRAIASDGVLRLEHWCAGIGPVDTPPGLVQRLRALRPLFVHIWVEDQVHLRSNVQAAWSQLIDGGVPVVAEILLKRGGIGSPVALRDLCLKLVEWRVRPYLMVAADWLPRHERIEAAEAMEWVRSLRGWISGLAVPQLVVEGLGGVRVVQIPAYVTALNDRGVEVVNYEGRHLRYLNPPEK